MLPLDICLLHAVVKGNVQGVGFRSLTRFCAVNLHLTGTVRNLPDGSVEIFAQGEKTTLEKLIKKLKEEAPRHIEEILIEFSFPKNTFEDFRIIHFD